MRISDRPRRGVWRMLRRHWRIILYPAGLLPAVWMLWLGQHDGLGSDPVKAFERALGLWAFRFLALCLLLVPLRMVSGLNFPRYRRLTGLLACFYAVLHVLVYAGLDHGFDWAVLGRDVTHRPFVILGMGALVMLLPLALTSNLRSMRVLGRNWKRLHLLVFPSALLASIHFYMAFKTLTDVSALYIGVMASALAWRLPGLLQAGRRLTR